MLDANKCRGSSDNGTREHKILTFHTTRHRNRHSHCTEAAVELQDKWTTPIKIHEIERKGGKVGKRSVMLAP
jgi:hypothetical protein